MECSALCCCMQNSLTAMPAQENCAGRNWQVSEVQEGSSAYHADESGPVPGAVHHFALRNGLEHGGALAGLLPEVLPAHEPLRARSSTRRHHHLVQHPGPLLGADHHGLQRPDVRPNETYLQKKKNCDCPTPCCTVDVQLLGTTVCGDTRLRMMTYRGEEYVPEHLWSGKPSNH